MFLLKKIFKVILQYLFNVFILFNTVPYIKFNFKQNIDPKMCTLKTWKKFGKPVKKFEKMSGNPVYVYFVYLKNIKAKR